MQIAQSNDLHHEYHHYQYQHIPMPNHHTQNRQNSTHFINDNHNVCVKQESWMVMRKIQGPKINTRGKNDNLGMDKVQGKV